MLLMATKPCIGLRPLTNRERQARHRLTPGYRAKATLAMRAWRQDRRDLALAARSVGGRV